jgi:hypothetical protein
MYLRTNLSLSVAATLALSGCAAARYESPLPGPNTAEVSIEMVGFRPHKRIDLFKDASECRGGWLVLVGPGEQHTTLQVTAGPTSFQLSSAALGGGFGITVNSCRGIVTFDAKPGERYVLTHQDTQEGCRFRLRQMRAGVFQDASGALRVRELADLRWPAGPNRPFCADSFTSGE